MIETAMPLPEGIIAYANYASFTPGRVIELGKVQSRMLLWCQSGRGTVTVNSRAFDFSAGCFLFLPWNHTIVYKADAANPYLVAGIHIIPALKSAVDFDYNVFHSERYELPEYWAREDAVIEGFSEIYAGHFDDYSQLKRLAVYIVEWFRRQPRQLFMARFLASALAIELIAEKNDTKPQASATPAGLKAAVDHIERNIGKPIDIDELVKAADCCRATLFRLFTAYLNATPGNYIMASKMRYAAELLRKSNLRVAQIATKTGIDDQYYFSKLFKKHHGITATEYRKRNSLMPIY